MSKETTSKETETTTESTAKSATATTESTTKSATVTTESTVKANTVVYIGPTIPGVVAANTTFNNGLTEAVKSVIADIPAINTLLVPISKLAQARTQLGQKDSVYDVCYNKVQQYIKKGE